MRTCEEGKDAERNKFSDLKRWKIFWWKWTRITRFVMKKNKRKG
jgi:hypothetical protein